MEPVTGIADHSNRGLGVGALAGRPLAVDGAGISAPAADPTSVYEHHAVDGHSASPLRAAARGCPGRADPGPDA